MEFDDEKKEDSQEVVEDFSFEKSNTGKKKRKVKKKRKSHKKTKDFKEEESTNITGNSQSQNESQKEIKEMSLSKSENEIKEEKNEDNNDNNKEQEKNTEENNSEQKEENLEENKDNKDNKEIKENDIKEKEEENKDNQEQKNNEEINDKNKENKEKENIPEKTEEKKDEKNPEENKPEEKKEEKKKEEYQGPKKISEYDLINQDPYLKNFEWCIKRRNEHFKNLLHQIESNEKSLENFSNSYKNMGLHVLPNGDIKYREYAPGARGIALFGEFNNWNRDQYWAKRDQYGFWDLIIPNEDGKPRIKHKSKVKCNVVLSNGQWADRNPIWIEYLYQNTQSLIFDGVFWNPEKKYEWKYPKKHLPRPKSLRIYEAHVGMSSFYPKATTYKDFTENILPRIKRLGYTAVQLMAIMHHANYASFGYHVNNFFAISSLFGTPEDLMELIDKAHEMGLFMIMDIVHSHASSNVDDGFNNWDGTDYLYFHGGKMGHHSLWDSRLFNYSSYETLRFLLSNCAYYSEKFRFDGFRFDGVTSILYRNHGIKYSFSGDYNEYFSNNFDEDGGVYLMLANKLLHQINPEVITIAEDVSGMPGLCLTVEQGGFGFDYRLNMSVSDKWIQLLKEYKDENWNMGNLVFTLTNRRYNEKHIGYCESHDQSIVGDKTIAMWLFDKEMYWNMSCNSPETIIISRGMSLHKLIRMITFALGGEGYLCFMGNEFGHPEWVDFPRPGNGFSYSHCRRRWDLCDNKNLRYKYLYNWDVAMNKLDDVFNFISSPFQYVSLKHEDDKIIVFEKGDLLFVFNFHPYKSYENYKIGTKWGTKHKIVLDSDEFRFFGKGRLEYGHGNFFPIINQGWNNRPNQFNLYIPSRTCMVLIAEENIKKYDLDKFTFETIE